MKIMKNNSTFLISLALSELRSYYFLVSTKPLVIASDGKVAAIL